MNISKNLNINIGIKVVEGRKKKTIHITIQDREKGTNTEIEVIAEIGPEKE